MKNTSNNDEPRPGGEGAHVTSLDAIGRMAAGLREFEDEARRALLAIDQQIARALEWFDHEQPLYWERRIRECYDEVARARSALENCQMRVVDGQRPACLEEEQALRAAKASLERALAKPDQIRQIAIRVHQEVDEFRAHSAGLGRRIDGGIPQAVALLERTLTILEEYAERSAGADPGESAVTSPSEPPASRKSSSRKE